jgi:hypothetical protein
VQYWLPRMSGLGWYRHAFLNDQIRVISICNFSSFLYTSKLSFLVSLLLITPTPNSLMLNYSHWRIRHDMSLKISFQTLIAYTKLLWIYHDCISVFSQTTIMSLQKVSINIFCEFCNYTVVYLPFILNMNGKLLFLKYKLEQIDLLIENSVTPCYSVHKSNCSYRNWKKYVSSFFQVSFHFHCTSDWFILFSFSMHTKIFITMFITQSLINCFTLLNLLAHCLIFYSRKTPPIQQILIRIGIIHYSILG